ncbi:lipid-binding SYLF domain-containing protein [Psychromarinibacter halotolerans]|uniref:Lipid-binding SYLF domain-containing protein n=1 Tax=Psychromarinibacter halotolerans TaxID=1775175 RepID=A0ABV7GV17_9RHOB|nr:lipid-binding SYLF domain-containing protein [Psychromarinibacter halotolerans]MDF0594920.1 lipid-binding SYLF domain-containing protein [Psychromarinibacter halotolerans]
MTIPSRRGFIAGLGSAGFLAACGNGVGSNGAQMIDARVDQTLNFLYSKYPQTTDLRDKSVGMLVMPLVTKAGFGLGGSYGRGALRVNNATVDYYSAAAGTIGLQIGAQQYSHVLFFMTTEALENFRRSPGWSAGADVEYTLNQNGENLSADTTTAMLPIIAVIFGQAGLIAGATLKGTKYTRIIP